MKYLHPLHSVFLLAALLTLGTFWSLQPGKTLLYSDQPEKSANSMVAILHSRGIESEKSKDGDSSFKVMVDEGFFEQAVDLLSWYGYPREEASGAESFYNNSGIVSSPEQTRARYAHAVAMEISSTLEEINGIVSARVHVVLPRKDNFGEKQEDASVGVLIIYDPRSDIEAIEKSAEQLLMKSVEGMDSKNISVVSLPTKAWEFLDVENFRAGNKFLGIEVRPSSLDRFRLLVYSLSALIVLLLIMLGGVILSLAQTHADSPKPSKEEPLKAPNENKPT